METGAQRPRVLMVEDDVRLSAMVAEYLGDNGLDVAVRGTVADGVASLDRERYDALILDVMLPDGDGIELCRTLRARSTIPIIMLTARGDEVDRVVGLEVGADDYLPKPFSPRELLARLRAVIRRSAFSRETARAMRIGNLEIDAGARTIRIDGELRALTSFQFDLLWELARNAGRVLSRNQLMNSLRGESVGPFDRAIDVHVSRIRMAIEEDPKHPRRLITVRGVGYVLATEAMPPED